MANLSKFKLGEEVTYFSNKSADPILLTYVETMKDGLCRFFSSQFPSLEYHLAHDSNNIKPHEEKYEEEVQESYHAFKGGDENKKRAYEILLARRRPHVISKSR